MFLEGITVGGKTLREHLEVINHRDAILLVEDIVSRNESLSERKIKDINALILKGINDTYAGVYRDQQVIIAGAKHIPPEPFLIKERMKNLMNWYEAEGANLHPVERAALLHIIFVGIHPFIDGNGRTSRLLLNLELMKNGYPPIIIRNESRIKYYNALDKTHTTGENQDFIELIVEELNKTFDLYLNLIN